MPGRDQQKVLFGYHIMAVWRDHYGGYPSVQPGLILLLPLRVFRCTREGFYMVVGESEEMRTFPGPVSFRKGWMMIRVGSAR